MMKCVCVCVYLWGWRAENAGGSTDKVSYEQSETRQSEEEETRRTGADDGVHDILVTQTETHTQTHTLVSRNQAVISHTDIIIH